MDVTVAGSHRFYPFQILVWHEIVNETFGGEHLVVTYSPLSGSSVVYRRDHEGTMYTFGPSKKLYDNSLVMMDRETSSLWSQVTGMALTGDQQGSTLEIYPSQLMTWADWKERFPYGSVLSRQTGFERDYTSSPYPDYETSDDIFFPLSRLDNRMEPKTLIEPKEGLRVYWFVWAAMYPEAEVWSGKVME